MATIKVCDLCGEKISENDKSGELTLYKPVLMYNKLESYQETHYDVCRKCSDDLLGKLPYKDGMQY